MQVQSLKKQQPHYYQYHHQLYSTYHTRTIAANTQKHWQEKSKMRSRLFWAREKGEHCVQTADGRMLPYRSASTPALCVSHMHAANFHFSATKWLLWNIVTLRLQTSVSLLQWLYAMLLVVKPWRVLCDVVMQSFASLYKAAYHLLPCYSHLLSSSSK
jgi:hypothetical protein